MASTLFGELRLARRAVREGRLERTLAIMAVYASIVSGWEAYAQHLRGAYSNWLMWTPVYLTAPTATAAATAVVSKRAAKHVLPVVALISLVDGVVGFVYHLRGIQRLPGGFRLGQYNVVMGPPVFAPLLTCMVGVLGLLSALARREVPREPVFGQAIELGDLLMPRASRHRRLEDDVRHGRFQQGLALVSAVFAVLAGGEAYFEHLRGSFNRRWMWTPIKLTPPMVVAAIGTAREPRFAHRVLPATSIVTFLDGALGFALHLQGIQRMPGGFRDLQFNFTMGPPVFAPLLFSSVGLLGLIASLIRRERG